MSDSRPTSPTTDHQRSRRRHQPSWTMLALDCAMWVLAVVLVVSLNVDGGPRDPFGTGTGSRLCSR